MRKYVFHLNINNFKCFKKMFIIAEYERNLKLHQDVIRFITIRIKDYDGKPSVIFQHSSESNKE